MISAKQKMLGWLFILMVASQWSFAQERTYFSDSTSFFEFLTNQDQVPGLRFRYKLPPNFKFAERDTLHWKNSKNGVWQGSALDSVDQLVQFRNEMDSKKLAAASFEYLIYNVPADFNAASTFVSALLRCNDIFPKEKKTSSSADLVLLARNSTFQSDSNFGFDYFADYRVFMITVIITFFIIMTAGMIFLMIYFKSKRNKRELLKEEYTNSVIAPLTEILFEKTLEEITSITDVELETHFPIQLRKKRLYNEVLIEHIISLNKKMKGDFKSKLKALFKRLALDKISGSNLKSKKWDTIVSGLIQINEMDLVEYLPMVEKHLNSSNFHIRINAAATLLNISDDVDLTFLKDQKYPLSDLQQMHYLRIIKYLYSTRKLLMVGLFDSENPTVRLFGYKLVRMVGRVDLMENLGGIAEKASDEEKIEILKTIDSLGVPTYTNFINTCIKSSNPKLAKQAIKVAGSLGDESSEAIILEMLRSKPDFNLKKALLQGLNNINRDSFETLIESSNDSESLEIYNHLKDPLLGYV